MALSLVPPMNSTNGYISAPLSSEDLTATPIGNEESRDALRAKGLIRAHALIPTELNERLKAMARKQGRNADQLIGELLEKSAAEVDRWEAEQEVARLRERFGDNWLEVLREADDQI